VLNSTNGVVSAQDYDAWGYPLESRSYQSGEVRYKFTGKEKDKDLENNYDYFGARYYDSRIANWTSIDPLFEKHFDYSPYTFVMRNPLAFIDPDGMDGDPASIAFPNEATRSFIDEARQWSRDNRMLLTVAKRVPYFGPVISYADILLSLPEPKIRESNIAIIQRFTADFISVDGIKEITVEVGRLYSKDGIYIPDEGKISNDDLNPPSKRGLAPTSKETGKPIDIHHIGQKKGGPYEERHRHDHRTDGSYKKHHDPNKKSEREKNWSNLVKKYWQQEWDKGRFK